MDVPSSQAPAPGTSASSGRRLSPPRLVGGAAAILALTALAALQPEWPDPLGAPGALARLAYPIEINRALRLPAVRGDLRALCATADGQRFWAAGSGGLVLRSRDGGANWERVDLAGRIRDAAVRRPTLRAQAWEALLPIAAAQAGEPAPYESQAGENKEGAPDAAADPRVQQRLRRRLEAAREAAAVPNAPATALQPAIEPDPARVDFHAVLCDAGGVWLAGAGGVVLHAEDGGDSWLRERVGFEDYRGTWHALSLDESGAAWLAGSEGALVLQPRRGEPWRRIDTGLSGPLHAVRATSGRATVAGSGALLAVEDGRLQALAEGGDGDFQALAQSGPLAWSLASDGRLVELGGGRRLQVEAGARLAALAGGAGFLWVAGERGVIRKAIGEPPVWQSQDLAGGGTLHAILALDAERAWVAGSDGRLLRTVDGGAHWRPQTRPVDLRLEDGRYWRLPAPWYYVAAFGLFLFAGARSRTPETGEAATRASVADLLVSDRPLQRGDPDPVRLGEVAAGLSRFLRNERTEPPLTIAVTGEWGSGKSSLMNLLRDDLAARGFRPVWFNAWHHQKGEQLLPALFAAISSQGIPPLLSVAGINFRLNLLINRGWQHGFVTGLMVLLLAALLVYVTRRPEELGVLTGWLDLLNRAPEDDAALGALVDAFIRGGLALPPLLAFARAVRAFRLNPVTLMSSIAADTEPRVLKQQPSARARFAAEFEDVTDALGDFRLTLFIDDLDRCEAEHVVEVLEAVNFLVSSGRCFVVMAMDEKWVQTCVGLKYKDIAAERVQLEAGDGDGVRQRREFARLYLEKLINIEVPVPQLEDAAAQALMAPAPLPPAPALARAARTAEAYAPWLLVLVPLWLGASLGTWLSEQSTPAPPQVARAAPVAADGATPVAAATALPGAPATPLAAASFAAFEPAQPANPWPQIGLLALAFTLSALLLRQLARQQALTHDSPLFQAALALWHPWVIARQRTPRAIKRFINRVRYIAMRSRNEREAPELLQRLRAWLGGSGPAGTPLRATALPEPTLVALAAIHELLPECLSPEHAYRLNDTLLERLQQLLPAPAPGAAADGASAMLLVELQRAVHRHGDAFAAAGWPPSAEQVEEFLRILARTQVR